MHHKITIFTANRSPTILMNSVADIVIFSESIYQLLWGYILLSYFNTHTCPSFSLL